ncbi:MAG: hypothetical protein A2X49_14210 [Lentisphaerae bacterium GWF2_52_8]|nr:MAG: hypothetical protein A2X49_14210 [Lentisphaerae bacterium GWF2_52_8]
MSFGYLKRKSSGNKLKDALLFIWDLKARLEGAGNLLKMAQAPAVSACLDIKPNERVLEIGAGSCAYAYEFSKKASYYVATDIFDMSKKASDRVFPQKLQRLTCDAHNLPFADSSFDLVFMSELIPVLSDPIKALTEASRVLNAEGRLVMVNGGAYLHVKDFFHSKNRVLSLLRKRGVARGKIPSNYDDYHSKLIATHGTNYEFFVDRDTYLKRIIDNTGFEVKKWTYAIRKPANLFYQFLCFERACRTGEMTPSQGYIYLLPLVRLIDFLTPEGPRGMTLLVSCVKIHKQ